LTGTSLPFALSLVEGLRQFDKLRTGPARLSPNGVVS